jgi:hypothetical protein
MLSVWGGEMSAGDAMPESRKIMLGEETARKALQSYFPIK